MDRSQQSEDTSLQAPIKDSWCDSVTGSIPNSHRSSMKRAELAQETAEYECQPSLGNSKPCTCLQGLFPGITYSWATSTLASYYRLLHWFHIFCDYCHEPFPLSGSSPSTIEDFLCTICDSSDQPASQLRTASAATGCLYGSKGLRNPMGDVEIGHLLSGLVKSGTLAPSRRTKVMLCEPFMKLFSSWPENASLSINALQLKAITLLALCLMTRPSDLAPKGVIFSAFYIGHCPLCCSAIRSASMLTVL